MIDFLKNTYHLFIHMAPYLMFGFFLAGILYVIIPKNKIQRALGKGGIISSIKAALIGVPLPLCSCSVIPTAISLRKNQASKSSIMSFLISTPQTGADSIIVTYSFLGPIFATFRVIFAFISGILGGLFIHLTGKKNKQNSKVENKDEMLTEKHPAGIKKKIATIFKYGYGNLLDDISLHLLTGIILAGLIATFLPMNVAKSVGNGLIGKLLMIAVGIPMYICSTASVPIAIALIAKGVSPGTAFVFLMAGPATNAASLTVISKSIGKKFAFYMAGIILLFSLVGGISLDAIYSLLPSSLIPSRAQITELLPHYVYVILAVIFALIMLYSLTKKAILFYKSKTTKVCKTDACKINTKEQSISTIKLAITGMTCNHCKMAVEKALKNTKGVESVEVSLEDANAVVFGENIDEDEIKLVVRQAGYTAETAA